MKWRIESRKFTDDEFRNEYAVHEFIAITAAKMGERFAWSRQRVDTDRIGVFHSQSDGIHNIAVKIYAEEKS